MPRRLERSERTGWLTADGGSRIGPEVAMLFSMARSCPACSRPNGDQAAKCLYCSEPLEPIPPLPGTGSGPEDEPGLELAPPPEIEGHLLILIPGAPPDDRQVESLAGMAGLSRYDARLNLASTRPRVFRRLESEELARRLSDQLRACQIPHYVVSEQSVRALAVSRAQSVKLEPKHLEVRLEGRNVSLPYASLLLLVRGEITREKHNEKNVATARGASRSLTPGLLLHLYSHEASVAVEIDPESIGWPDFDGTLSKSALLNLERFVDALEERTSGVPVDRGFDLEPPVLSRASGGTQDLAQVLSGGSSGGVLYDNQEQFRFYARWRYRLERHLRHARGPRLVPDDTSA